MPATQCITLVGQMSKSLHVAYSDGRQKPRIWSSPKGRSKIEIGKQIFFNRALNMQNIFIVSFGI